MGGKGAQPTLSVSGRSGWVRAVTSVREMVEALIDGQRSPRLLAGLARSRIKLKHADLVDALTGQFDEHHADLARMLLDQTPRQTQGPRRGRTLDNQTPIEPDPAKNTPDHLALPSSS